MSADHCGSASLCCHTAKKECEALEGYKVPFATKNELVRTVKHLRRTIWKNGLHITIEIWYKPRCIASNYWEINSVQGVFDSPVNEIHVYIRVK